MTISKELFLAILSMDSYNRGYEPGIEHTHSDASDGLAKIGIATVSVNLDDVGLAPSAHDAGFYAVAYDISNSIGLPELNGGCSISARADRQLCR